MNKQFAFYLIPFFAACAVIFYQFPTLPAHFSYDEVSFTRLALSLAHQPYTAYSQLATGHSTLYFYIILISLKVFGITALGLRLPSAIFGVVSVLLFVSIIKKVSSSTLIAVIAGTVMALSRWYFNFARFAFEPTFLIMLELASLVFLLRALTSKRMSDVLWCGLFAGLAFHSYYPGKIFFILPLAMLAVSARRLTGYFLGAFIMVIIPLVLYYTTHADIRVSQLSVLSDPHRTTTQKIIAIADNGIKTAGMFVVKGDMNGRHNFPGKPALNPLASLLFIIGIGIALSRITSNHVLLLVSYFGISLIPALLTVPIDNPSMLRTVTSIPSVVYFMMLPVIGVYRLKSRYRIMLLGCCVVFLGASILYDLRTYFMFQARVVRNSFEVTCPLSELMKEKTDFVPKRCRVAKNLF